MPPSSRAYPDACGMSHALDLIGQRWALHVVRELLLTPKRFRDLAADLPGIATNVLTDRLTELEGHGLVRRRRDPDRPAVWSYELTTFGAELEPVITALGRWALRSPAHRADLPLSATAFAISLRANLLADRAAAVTGCHLLRLPGLDLHAHLDQGDLRVEAGTLHAPDVEVAGSVETVAALVYDGADLSTLVTAGEVTVTGDGVAAEQFFALFAFPEQVVDAP